MTSLVFENFYFDYYSCSFGLGLGLGLGLEFRVMVRFLNFITKCPIITTDYNLSQRNVCQAFPIFRLTNEADSGLIKKITRFSRKITKKETKSRDLVINHEEWHRCF